MSYVPSSNVILVPVNRCICKTVLILHKIAIQTTNWKTMVQLTSEKKQKKKQASSQTKQKLFKRFQKKKHVKQALKLSAIISL